jgi:predicted dehydrogenase
MEKVGLGIIGLGYIGVIHLRHSSMLSNASLMAVSDVSRKALKKAEDFGVKKAFTSYEQLLKMPDIDAVIIALPTYLHLQCVEHAAEAGKHIFLEKPIARNVKEAMKIVSAAERNSVKLMIGYPLRFDTRFQHLKKQVGSGLLGDVEVAYATHIGSGPFFHRADGYTPIPVPEWWFEKEKTGGGALLDAGCHIINLLQWYFGEIIDIRAHLERKFNIDVEDSATCLAKFNSGTVAIINVGWFSQQFQVKVELLGTVRHATAEQRAPNPLSTAVQMLTRGYSEFYRSHFNELQYFADCLVHDVSPSPSGEEGLRDLEVISLAYDNEMFPKPE